MEPIRLFKTLQEAQMALGFAGFILVVFIFVFIILVYRVLKIQDKLTEKYEDISKGVNELGGNDDRFERLMNELITAVKELSSTNRIVAETVSKLDFYNKDLRKKLEKHDEKAEKILEEARKR